MLKSTYVLSRENPWKIKCDYKGCCAVDSAECCGQVCMIEESTQSKPKPDFGAWCSGQPASLDLSLFMMRKEDR